MDNKMTITMFDIWWNKIIKYGWKIEDIPKKYKELRKELRRRLKNNGSQGRKSAPGINN